MNRKALALLSGGLDSILAIRIIREQGVEVEAVNFRAVFCDCAGKDGGNLAEKAAGMLGVPLRVIDFTEEFLEVVKNPRYGYGANINPCIDCRIFMFKKVKALFGETGASFIVTGEVVGERPMSQRKDALALIDKRADVKGIVLRPLSAKLLEPTAAEESGVVDRGRLLDISGRSRKPQMALAEKFGIRDYPNPAGGCLLTDPGFAKRVRDLIEHDSLDIENLRLLKVGRHFRLSADAKLVVGRDEEDNGLIQSLTRPGDIFFKLKDHQGPLSVLRAQVLPPDDELAGRAAAVACYHTKFRDEAELRIDWWECSSPSARKTILTKPAAAAEVERMRI